MGNSPGKRKVESNCKTAPRWYKWLVDFAMSTKRYRLKGKPSVEVEVLAEAESRTAAKIKRRALIYRALRDDVLSVRDEAEFREYFEPVPS